MVYLSSSCFQNDSIEVSVNRAFDISSYIELSGGSEYDENSLETLKAFRSENGCHYLVHSYFPPPKEHFILNFADSSNRTRDFISRSMDYVYALDTPYYSVHAGFRKPLKSMENVILGEGAYSFDNIMDNSDWFHARYPEKRLIVENMYPIRGMEDACYAMTPEEIIAVLEADERLGLLLDLGHLKVSSRLLGFNYLDGVTLLFEKYGSRILELHLSENDGFSDNHQAVYSDSVQYFILDRYADLILSNKINLVIETRNHESEAIRENYALIKTILERRK